MPRTYSEWIAFFKVQLVEIDKEMAVEAARILGPRELERGRAKLKYEQAQAKFEQAKADYANSLVKIESMSTPALRRLSKHRAKIIAQMNTPLP